MNMAESLYTESFTKKPKTIKRRFLVYLQNFTDLIKSPFDHLDDLWWMFLKKFYHRPHLLDSKLPSTHYLSIERRILHASFEEFCSHMECEIPSLYICLDIENREYTEYTWFDKTFGEWFGIPKKDPILLLTALDNMENDNFYIEDHQKSYLGEYLKEIGHSIPQEIKELYIWWASRKYRDDAEDLSGLTDFHESLPGDRIYFGYDHNDNLAVKIDNMTDEQAARAKIASDKYEAVQKEQDDEDRQMLVRLVKLLHFVEL